MRARAALLAIALSLAGGRGLAAPTGTAAAGQIERVRERLKRSIRERNIGWAVAGVGLATVATGAVLAWVRPLYGGFDTGALYQLDGGITAGVGAAIVIAGAAAALHGQNSMTDLANTIRQLGERRFRPLAFAIPGGAMVGAGGSF